eukprot:CAMPEP_0182434040 /NCGR_PEP_ID=MMETSP1167-20130531/67202_1 /TAXON_ID=2988 /ORGANISM="Mallomonas Sp, Strain CCMP3275" /LENGTH=167 /DNA_ID=CAMNT_0024623441 /DNA_START=875 /DNA_END=1378 /DNA_ORIENTATION=-
MAWDTAGCTTLPITLNLLRERSLNITVQDKLKNTLAFASISLTLFTLALDRTYCVTGSLMDGEGRGIGCVSLVASCSASNQTRVEHTPVQAVQGDIVTSIVAPTDNIKQDYKPMRTSVSSIGSSESYVLKHVSTDSGEIEDDSALEADGDETGYAEDFAEDSIEESL